MTGIIDVHHHALPPAYTAELAAAGIESLPGYGFPDWSPRQSIQMMDENGIERAVLSVSAPGLYFGDDLQTRRLARTSNEYLADLVGSEPRFGAFGCLPLPNVEASIAEAELVLERFGLQGVVIYTNSGGTYPGDERLDPLMSYLSSRQAVVFVHPVQPCGQHAAPFAVRPSILEFVFESTRAAASLIASRSLTRFPGIRFVLTHGGGTLPFLSERLGHLRRDQRVERRDSIEVGSDLANFFYDLASCTRPHALACLSSVTAPEHLLFGTDFPFESSATVAAAVTELQENAAVQANSHDGLWRENAARILAPAPRWPASSGGRGEPPGTGGAGLETDRAGGTTYPGSPRSER